MRCQVGHVPLLQATVLGYSSYLGTNRVGDGEVSVSYCETIGLRANSLSRGAAKRDLVNGLSRAL